MSDRIRLGVRTRLLLTVAGAVTVALIVGVAAFYFFLGQRLSDSATSLAHAQAEAELSSLRVEDGRLVAPEGLDEGQLATTVWVFDSRRMLEAPRAGAKLHRLARSLANGPERVVDEGERTRLYALPVRDERGRRVGTVVAGVSLEPYEETGRAALVGALVLGALLLVAVIVLTRWILARALRPVARMTADANAWSDAASDRRFQLGEPYDELTRLGATLDALLERVASALRHEQRLTAELSHELRTPLARIVAEAELALRRPRSGDEYRAALELVRRSGEQMTRIVQALVDAARHEASGTRRSSDARDAVSRSVEAARAGANGRTLELSLPSAPVRVAVETDLLERIVQPLLDNALRYGRERVDVAVTVDARNVVVSVVDDGPGVAAAETERIFDPGVRGSAASRSQAGAGLGLALARRLAQSVGGVIEVHVETGRAGGSFSLRLPVA